jgi:hypothetical protein
VFKLVLLRDHNYRWLLPRVLMQIAEGGK